MTEFIDPDTLAHSEWLWKLADERSNSLSDEQRRRLRDVSCLLKFRPDIDMTGDFQFEVGKTYPTRGGKLVRIMGKTDIKGYECIQGDDMDPQSGYRYCRSTGTYDHGRSTGSRGDNPNNLLPIEIIDPRITKSKEASDLLVERADRIAEWMEEQGNTPAEMRAARIAMGHLIGQSTDELREREE